MLFDKRWETKPIDEVSRILYQAADLIEHCGHAQGAYHIHGTYCMMGAISCAATDGESCTDLDTKRYEAACRLWHVIGEMPMSWNDERGRTGEEVVAVLRDAARWRS